MEDLEILLPTSRTVAGQVSPRKLLIYSPPKVGKTSVISQLEDCLVVETEPGGADYVDVMKVDIDEGDVIKNAQKFNKLLDLLSKEKPYKYVAFDTVTRLDEWSEIVGTIRYMQTAQGKKFNRDEKGNLIMPNDPEFETVHSLPNGYGYRHSRDVMSEWFDKMCQCAQHVIFIAHVKDVYVANKAGDTVQTLDINLTGKVKDIFGSKVDSIAYLHRIDGKGYLSFKSKDTKYSGSRPSHLKDDILISEMVDGKLKTYWDKIYLNDKKSV